MPNQDHRLRDLVDDRFRSPLLVDAVKAQFIWRMLGVMITDASILRPPHISDTLGIVMRRLVQDELRLVQQSAVKQTLRTIPIAGLAHAEVVHLMSKPVRIRHVVHVGCGSTPETLVNVLSAPNLVVEAASAIDVDRQCVTDADEVFRNSNFSAVVHVDWANGAAFNFCRNDLIIVSADIDDEQTVLGRILDTAPRGARVVLRRSLDEMAVRSQNTPIPDDHEIIGTAEAPSLHLISRVFQIPTGKH